MDGCPIFVGVDRGWRRSMVVEYRRPQVLRPSHLNSAAGRHGCRTGATFNIQSCSAISGTGHRTCRVTHSPRTGEGIDQPSGRSHVHTTYPSQAYHSAAGD